MWQYYFLKIISSIVASLPNKLKRLVGKSLGNIIWYFVPVWRKRLAVDQVKTCLNVSQKEACVIAKKSVTKYGFMLAEVMSFPKLNQSNIKNKVIFQNQAQLDELFAEKNGVVLATAHFGNWELHGAALALYGYPLVAVAQELLNKPVDRFINEYRSLTGEHVTYKTGVLEMARMLAEGFALGLLCDQDGGNDGVVVDFFGRKTSCPKGPAALARLRGAPLVLTLLYDKKDGTHEVYVSKEISVKRTKDREKDIKDATIELMQKLEEAIKKQPEMWFWLHNRWKVDRQKYK